MKTRLLSLLLLLVLTAFTTFAQTIRYVKAGGTGNGSSWANASGDLQAMINASAANDQVWVAAGTYKPTITTDRTISFSMRPNLAIYGGFVGNETSLSARPAVNPVTGSPSNSILSGDIGTVGDNSDNSAHVINNPGGLTTTAILDGFVITGGNANVPNSNQTDYSGGGMRNVTYSQFDQGGQVSPLIQNCYFVANSAAQTGGAIYNGSLGCGSKTNPTLINCLFKSNSANQGGAIANDGIAYSASCGGKSSPTLTNCSFQSNSATLFGGAMYNNGYGSPYADSSPTLNNCSFQGNTTTNSGGAIYNVGARNGRSYPKLTNCSFLNNTATGVGAVGGFGRGGAITNDGSDGVCDPTLTNCSFQGNTATLEGGAMTMYTSTTGECMSTMINCVVFGNGGAKTFAPANNYVQAYYSLFDASVTGWLGMNEGGNRTVTASPFASSTNMQLAANSPAINAGDPATSTAGATDLAGNPRIVGCRVDMGALEYQYIFLPLAINAQPASSSVVCAGTAVSVPVSVSGTVSSYQWYKDGSSTPVAGQTSATLTLNNPQPSNAGSYLLVVTSTCNSLTTTAFNLTVNKPTVSISPSSATVCEGQSALLTASGASSYTWSNNTTGNTLSATTTGTYSVTGVDGNGCSATASSQVTVYRPTVSISPSSVGICAGQSALLTASGASTYIWSDNTTGNTLSTTTTGTYSVTGVDGNGCSNTATASVTVNSLPTVSISASPAASITPGNSVTLAAVATGATSYAWSTGSTSSSIVVSPTTTTPYSVTARSGAGCVASASQTITVVSPVCGPVIYVTQAGEGLRDGSSWGNALGANQLQLAINTAAGCGGNVQVWVAAGVYKPTTGSDRTISFALKNGVAIYGGFVGTETALSDRPSVNPVMGQPNATRPSSTTLSGDIGTVGNTGDNSFHVISNPASPSLTTSAVLDGFVITGGAGGTLGGGISNDASSPTIRNCSFVNNSVLVTSSPASSTSRGGAMYNGNGSSPQITNCSFQGNSVLGSGGTTSYGGAMSNYTNSSPQLTNCSFVNNSVTGSASNFGGAMTNNINSNPQLTNCSFLNNSATGGTTTRGGAMNNGNGCNPQLTNCSFLGNSVSGGTANQGGAIGNNNSSSQLTNCVVFDNGGDNTFYNNSTTATQSITSATYSLFDNTVTGYSSDPTNLTASTSPFASPTSVALAANSPAIDAGLSSAPGLSGISTDLAGNTRVVGCKVDMGALEFQSSTNQTLTSTQPVSSSVVCAGTAVSVPVSVSGTISGYQWYKDGSANPVAGQTSATLTLNSAQPSDAGSYSLVVTSTCNSLTTTAFNLTVNSPPTVASAGVSQTIVTGTGATLAANAPTVGTGSWSVVSGPSTNQAQFSNAGNPAAVFTPAGGQGSYGLVWTITNGSCAPSTSSLSITVLPANTTPVATGNANQTATVGTAFSYTINAFTDEAPASLTYTASISPGNGFSFDPLTRVISGTPLSTGISSVTITATDTGGLSASTSFSITTGCAALTASISGARTVCAGQSTNLTASGGTTYVWNTGATTASISATAGTYSVTVITSGCSATVTATVTATPAVVATLMASPSTTLSCAVSSLTLTAGGGSSYTFSPGASQLGTTNQAMVSSAGSYSVRVGDVSGCTSSTTLTISQDNTAPVATLSASPSTTLTCIQSSLTLTAGGGNAYVFSGPGVVSQSGNQAIVNAAGTYSVSVTAANGCSSTTSVSVSQNNTSPLVSISPSSGTLTCNSPSLMLTVNLGSSPSGRLAALAVFNGRWNTGATTPSISVTTAGTYSVTYTAPNGCTATASTTVEENKTPPMASLTNNGPLSATNPTVTLTAAPGGASYTFSTGATQQGGSSGNTATVTTPGTYSVGITGANGCTASAATTVTTTTSSQTACRNSRLVLTTARSASRYEWYKNGQTAANKLIDIASLQVGTTTASLTLVSVQTSATYYVKEIQAGGSVTWSGPFALTVDARCLARLGLDEPGLSLSLQVAPNPLAGGQLRAVITGAAQQPLSVWLTDLRGLTVAQQHWPLAQAEQVVSWDISQQPAGIYLLGAQTPTGQVTVRVLQR